MYMTMIGRIDPRSDGRVGFRGASARAPARRLRRRRRLGAARRCSARARVAARPKGSCATAGSSHTDGLEWHGTERIALRGGPPGLLIEHGRAPLGELCRLLVSGVDAFRSGPSTDDTLIVAAGFPGPGR
jgi:hypothetical protein